MSRRRLLTAGFVTGGALLSTQTASAQEAGDPAYRDAPNTFVFNRETQPSFLTGDGALVNIKQTTRGSTVGDIAFGVVDSDERDPYRVATYIMDGGAVFTGRWLVVSQKRKSSGEILGVSAKPDGTEDCMVQISPDVNAPGLAVEGKATGNLVGEHNNRTAMAVYDIDDIIGGATPYSKGYGKKRWAMLGDGKMLWGANLGIDPGPNTDVSLDRDAAGALKVASHGGLDARFSVNSPTGVPSLDLQRNGSTAFKFAANSTGTGQMLIGGSPVARLSNLGGTGAALSVGAEDEGAVGTFAVGANTSPSTRGLVARGRSGQVASLMELQDGSGNVQSRFDKNGYFMTRRTIAPADADLVTGELALWFDPTPKAAKLRIKAKTSAGVVVNGSVDLR
jgi:hypothetical protein